MGKTTAWEADVKDIITWPLEVFTDIKNVVSAKGHGIEAALPAAAALAFFVWYGGGFAGLRDIASKEPTKIAMQYFGTGLVFFAAEKVTEMGKTGPPTMATASVRTMGGAYAPGPMGA